MRFRIQTFYPVAGMFMNTNHEADTLGPLRELMNSETFAGFTAQIVDVDNRVVYGPQTLPRQSNLEVQDIANMLNVPLLTREELFEQISFDDDDDEEDRDDD